MKLKSDLEVAKNKTKALYNKQSSVCKMEKSIQASRSNLHSKLKPVSCDNDTFSVLSKLNSYLQKDIKHFETMAKAFDNIDKKSAKAMKV